MRNYDALAEALEFITSAEAIERLHDAASSGTLVLRVHEGGFAELADSRHQCWDGCNGITNYHRPGWCPVNPEHADLDCGCLGAHDEDYDDDEPDILAVIEPQLQARDILIDSMDDLCGAVAAMPVGRDVVQREADAIIARLAQHDPPILMGYPDQFKESTT